MPHSGGHDLCCAPQHADAFPTFGSGLLRGKALSGASIFSSAGLPPLMQIASGEGLFFEFPVAGFGVGGVDKRVTLNDFSCAF